MKNNYSNHIFLFVLLSIVIVLSLITNNIVYGFRENINYKISIVVPCIPRDVKHLDRLLNSIKNQTYKPHEIIIAMSGQSDKESEKLKQNLIKKYELPIKFSNVENKQGASANRNRGAKSCSGDLITFIDADDVMYPDKLLYVNNIYNKYQPKLFLHGFSLGYKKFYSPDMFYSTMFGTQLYDIAKNTEKHNKHGGILRGITHGHPTVSRDVMKKINFNEQLKVGEDTTFVREVINHYGRKENTAIFISIPLSQYIPSVYQKQVENVQNPKK